MGLVRSAGSFFASFAGPLYPTLPKASPTSWAPFLAEREGAKLPLSCFPHSFGPFLWGTPSPRPPARASFVGKPPSGAFLLSRPSLYYFPPHFGRLCEACDASHRRPVPLRGTALGGKPPIHPSRRNSKGPSGPSYCFFGVLRGLAP